MARYSLKPPSVRRTTVINHAIFDLSRPARRFLLVACLAMCLLAGAPAASQVEFQPIEALDSLNTLDEGLNEVDATADEVRRMQASAVETRRQAIACIDEMEPRVETLQQQAVILGEARPSDDSATDQQRFQIEEQLGAAEGLLSNCRLVRTRAENIIERADELLSELSSRRMWRQGEPIWRAIREARARWTTWPGLVKDALSTATKPAYSGTALAWTLIITMLLAAGLGVIINLRFMQWFSREKAEQGPPRLKFLFPKPLAKYAPVILAGLLGAAVVLMMSSEASVQIPLVRLTIAVLAYGIGCVLIEWSTGPLSPAAKIGGLIPDHVGPIRARLRWFLIALVTSFAVLGPGWLTQTPTGEDMLPRSLLSIFLVLPLLGLLLLSRRIPGLKSRYGFIRFAAIVAVLASIGAELLGYHNFSNYLLHGIVRTAMAAFALWMLLWLIDEGVAHISKGGTRSAYQMRTLLGLSPNPDEAKSAVALYQLTLDVVLWLAFILYLIDVWDTTGNTLKNLHFFVIEGFSLAGTEIVPAKLIYGLLVFAGLLIITGWIKRWIRKRWLRHMTMDRGARDALVTIVGYVGFIIATLVGLRLMGISLAGLAIAAAALSVGIGFGLQEIANNFISGLILLFERPIKSGDFVTVGTVEGFIRRISIRSTEIETLDNQNVIVPNSELITTQVTNWVLHDPHGRLRIQVGVAYGSDVDKVKEILEEVANQHPQVITDGRAPGPKALFMEFGDSSLNFELRVRIKRIEKRFDVTSDLNFAINRSFRENGVEIPFPQRDLHVRSWSEGAKLPPADLEPAADDRVDETADEEPDETDKGDIKKVVGYRDKRGD